MIPSRGSVLRFALALPRAVFALMAIVAILWWIAGLLTAARQAPRFSALDELTVVIPAGGEMVLGRAELMQPAGPQSAELRHVRLRALADGRLTISRVAELRGLNLEFGAGTEEGSSERYEVSQAKGAETELKVAGQTAKINALGDSIRVLVGQIAAGGTVATYKLSLQGELSLPDGRPAPRCYDQDWKEWIAEALSGFKQLVVPSGTKTLAILGGEKSCALSGAALIAMPLVDNTVEFSIRRNLSDGRLFVTRSRGGGHAPVSYRTSNGGRIEREHAGDSGLEWAVVAKDPGHPLVTFFTAGRTRYQIAAKADGKGGFAVTIRPSRRISLFIADLCTQAGTAGTVGARPEMEDCPPPLAGSPNPKPQDGSINANTRTVPIALERLFVGSGQGLSSPERLIRLGAICLAVTIILWAPPPFLLRRDRRAVWAYAGGAALLVLALVPELIPQVVGTGNGERDALIILGAMALLWVSATLALALDRVGGWRLSAFWFLLCVLAVIGSVSLFTMSAESPNTDWERFFVKHKLVVLDILPLLAIAVTLASPTALRRNLGNDLAGRPSWNSPLLWLIVGVSTLFLAWYFIGTQQGLFGSFQPVEAGKFAVVAFLGAALAQWLIRARLIAQAWFGLTAVAVALSISFIVLLLATPVLKSDYSPLIIIVSTALGAGIAGAALIGLRIREEERDDAAAFGRVPVAFLPKIRDRAASWWLLGLTLAAGSACALYAWEKGENTAAIAILAFLAWICILAACLRRIHRVLAMLALTGPLLAVAGAYYLQNLPIKVGLGVEQWSWWETPDRQIKMLQKALSEGRRLPVERLMSWADLRYGYLDQDGRPRAIELRDMDFHVMRSRAALARAPCAPSAEFSALPFGIGAAVAWFGSRLSHLLGDACKPYSSEAEKPSCAPASLKAAIRPHCVPVVQSDFAATYLAARHGEAIVALLALFQILLAMAALQVFLRLQAKRSRDPVATGADQAMALIALGSGLLFLMQWLLAWSNAFGLLPVMGQPMTWLSAATSHHLFMAIPAALSIMIAIRLAGLREAALPFREPPRRRN